MFIFFFAGPKKKTNQNKRSAPKGMFPRKKEKVFTLRWAVVCKVLGNWSDSV